MFLSDRSIERPVLTTVVTAAILLVGWIGYQNLPVRELPEIEFPIVSVQAVLPGANPEVVETEVTEILEEEINTIEGIRTLTSVSAEGVANITIEFELYRNIDVALQDVRSEVSRVRGELPNDLEEPVIRKLDPDAQAIMWLTLQHPELDMTEVNQFAENVLQDRLQTLQGVGSIQVGGARRFAIRIRLDAQSMAAYEVTVPEIRQALQQGNVEIPSGRVESEDREFTVRTAGELDTPEAFDDLIVAWRNGTPIRLEQVGTVEEGVENERTMARFNGEPTIGLGVVKQSEANTVELADRVLEEADAIREDLPAGYTLSVAVDDSIFIERSLEEVLETLFIAFALVVCVIFVFLHSGRATVIPSAAIPVSLVGTFAALYLLDFSINLLTLLALVLVIGIVIDDAIVVLENIYRHMEEGKSPMRAAREGTSEIAFAVVAISLTLVIVFLPLGFISGVVGRIMREFAFGVAVAVLISAFVALTLTPMLSSRYLRVGQMDNRFGRFVERGMGRVNAWYRDALQWSLRHRWIIVGVGVASLVASGGIMALMDQEFAPQQARGEFMISVNAPEGSTFEYTDGYMQQIEAHLGDLEPVRSYFSAIGLGGAGGQGAANSGIAFVRLEEETDVDQFELMARLRQDFSRLAGVQAFVLQGGGAGPGGGEKPLQFVMQSPDLEQLAETSERMLEAARGIEGLVGVDTNLELNKPELTVTIDRNRAASLGVRVSDVATTLQVLLGGQDISNFRRGNERYEVIAQLRETDRATPDDLRSIYLRGDEGMVQLASVVDVREGVGPSQINHFNRMRSVTLDANLEGISLGAGLERVRELGEEILPASFLTDVTGEAQLLEESIASLLFALLMAVIAIYLVLAGQFESFVHPFTIMLALPLALFGAVLTLAVFGMSLNIYSMIGIIMLMGLVTKNSILLVDYANQQREKGVAIRDAIVQAGLVRLRPILMTSISIIVGVMPIALALGAGAESRRPLGVAVVGGMTVSTALTLFVVPVFYLLFDEAVVRAGAGLRRLTGGSAEVPPGTAESETR